MIFFLIIAVWLLINALIFVMLIKEEREHDRTD